MGLPQEAQEDSKEYKLKAAFLFNFVKYCTWPEKAFEKDDSPVVVAVIGEDPFGEALEKALEDKKVGKRPLVLRRIERLEDVKDVHLLFVGKLPEKERAKLLKALEKSSTLVVENHDREVGQGVHLGFYLEDGKVRFAVSPKALKASGLSLSSQLLKLAKNVDKE